MAIRLAPCPQSKTIRGTKDWAGFLPFNFPGFVGTWDIGKSTALSWNFGSLSNDPYVPGWTEGWEGGAPATINVGDLVKRAWPSLTINGVTYPETFEIWKCIKAGATAGGRSVDPGQDSTLNDGALQDISTGTWYGDTAEAGGPFFEPWDFTAALIPSPTNMTDIVNNGSGLRAVWNDNSSTTAYLTATVETVIANYPIYDSTNFTADDAGATNYLNLTDGDFTTVWSANQWTAALSSSGGGSPTTAQAAVLYPLVPLNVIYGTENALPIALHTGQIIGHGTSTIPLPAISGYAPIVSLTATATEIEVVFGVYAVQPYYADEDNSLALPAGTITQTITLSDAYTQAENFSDAEALIATPTFADMSWNQSASNTYNADGSIHTTYGTLAATVAGWSDCAEDAATVAAGYAQTLLTSNGWDWTLQKAQVDLCGSYCLRTLYCQRTPPLVDCSTGTVDGYAPVELDAPTIDTTLGDNNVFTFLFLNCSSCV